MEEAQNRTKDSSKKPALKKAWNHNSEQKTHMEFILKSLFGNDELLKEYQFHPTRKWRFDFALINIKVAIEYEGIFRGKSGHTTHGGFIKDTQKYNAAATMGWRVLRYTANNYKEVHSDLKQLVLNEKRNG